MSGQQPGRGMTIALWETMKIFLRIVTIALLAWVLPGTGAPDALAAGSDAVRAWRFSCPSFAIDSASAAWSLPTNSPGTPGPV